MPADILVIIANVALDLFTVTGMLAVGMGLTVGQIVRPLRSWALVALVLLANFVLLPAWAVALGVVLPMGDAQRTALVLLGASAGGPFIPALARIAKGDRPLAAGMMALLLIVTVAYVPLALPVMLPYVYVDAALIARDLALFMLLPLVVGLLIRWRYATMAENWQPHASRFSTYSLLLVVAAGLPVARPKIISVIGSWLIVGAVLLALGGALIGYLLALRDRPAFRSVRALGVGQRNLAAALLIAAHAFGGDTFVSTLVAAVVVTVLMHIVAAEWGRRTPDAPEVGDGSSGPIPKHLRRK